MSEQLQQELDQVKSINGQLQTELQNYRFLAKQAQTIEKLQENIQSLQKQAQEIIGSKDAEIATLTAKLTADVSCDQAACDPAEES